MKSNKKYWEGISSPSVSSSSDRAGPESTSKIGTVRQAVTLLPQQEYLVWGKLPSGARVSPRSTVIVEPTSAHSAPNNILVWRVITPMWGGRWVPMKVLNASLDPVILCRNAKLAEVSPCLAVEDLPVPQGLQRQCDTPGLATSPQESADPTQLLKHCGLSGGNIEAFVSAEWKAGRDPREVPRCLLEGQAGLWGGTKDFVHRIHLSDDRPFRLSNCRISPSHYHKLREVLIKMDEKQLITK